MVMILQNVTTTTDVDPAALATLGVFYVLFLAVVYVITCLPLYGIFKKAAHPDVPAWAAWAAWVPVYNTYAVCKLAGRPGWWTLLFFLPVANLVAAVLVYNDLSTSFGHGAAFTVGLVLVPQVFLFILWLGPSRYLGPAALPQGQPRFG